MLTAKEILACADVVYDVVNVPEWGGDVRVRSLSGKEYDEYQISLTDDNGKATDASMRNMSARLVALCAVDDSGARLFTDAQAEVLGDKSHAALKRVYDAAARLNGLGNKELERSVKN